MWKPSDLRFYFNLMQSGELDNCTAKEVESIISTNQEEVNKYKDKMPKVLLAECSSILTALKRYYRARDSKESQAKRAKGEVTKTSPTEEFRRKHGKNPTDVYREQFGGFNKTEYSKWLYAQVRQIRGEA